MGLPFALLLAAACPQAGPSREQGSLAPVLRELASKGVRADPSGGLIEIDASICQRVEPLEYLLVIAPRGKDHESLVSTRDLSAEALNAAMLLLGVHKGENARLIPRDPPPTKEEIEKGIYPYKVEPARGDGFYIYLSWEVKEKDGPPERFFYRAEDLVLNVRRQQTYKRGKWVYLGSRFFKPHKDAPELFAAEAEGNLVSLCNFNPPSHLLTGADPEADNQYIWYPNLYLLPEIGHPVKVLFSRRPLEGPPPTVLREQPGPGRQAVEHP
ncbi:MAG: YdjY domain-containing protein [Planctomycetota bacterium]